MSPASIDNNVTLKNCDNSEIYLAKRFIFPQKENSQEDCFVDNRTEAEIFRDIINVMNEKLPPDLAELWSKVASRDIQNPCYYRSGLSFLQKQMRELQQEFKFKNKLVMNPESNIPDTLSSQPHDKLCSVSTSSGQCSYSTELYFDKATDILQYVVKNWNKQSVFNIFSNIKNVDKLILHILRYEITDKQRKRLNRLLIINNTPYKKLKLSYLKYIW